MGRLIYFILTPLIIALVLASTIVDHGNGVAVEYRELSAYGGSARYTRSAPIVDIGSAPVVDLDSDPIVDLDSASIVDLGSAPVHDNDEHDNNDKVPGITLTELKATGSTLLPEAAPPQNLASSILRLPTVWSIPTTLFKSLVALEEAVTAAIKSLHSEPAKSVVEHREGGWCCVHEFCTPCDPNSASALKVPNAFSAPSKVIKMLATIPHLIAAAPVAESGTGTDGVDSQEFLPIPHITLSLATGDLPTNASPNADTTVLCCLDNDCHVCDESDNASPIPIADRDLKSDAANTSIVHLLPPPTSAGSHLRIPSIFVALKLLSSPALSLAEEFINQKCTDCSDPVCVKLSNSVCPRPSYYPNGTMVLPVSPAETLRPSLAFTFILSGVKKVMSVVLPDLRLGNPLDYLTGEEKKMIAADLGHTVFSSFIWVLVRAAAFISAFTVAAAGWEGRIEVAWAAAMLLAVYFAWNLS